MFSTLHLETFRIFGVELITISDISATTVTIVTDTVTLIGH